MLKGVLGGMGGGGGMMPTIVQIPGMGGGMGGMGAGMSCGNPNCPDCGGGMGEGMLPGIICMPGGGGAMGGAQCSCGDPNCPIGRQSLVPGCPCEDCQRQGMGGMGGGGEMMPPIMGPTSCGDPDCPDCGGGGMGGGGGVMQPGGQALPPTGSDVNMTPKLRCLGTTGQEIDCTIDTDMQSNGQVTPSAYRKHFAGAPIDTSVPYSGQGVGAAVAKMLGRFLMVLTLDFGGERVEVSGNIWIYPNENVACELLIGMNFLKANMMNMRFDDGSDTIEVQGKRFPLNIIANRFYRQWPAGEEPAHEGSGGKMYKLGGSDIVTQNGYIMGMTEKGVHAYNARQHHIAAAYRMRGHDVRHKHMEPGHVSGIEDSDEELQQALNLSREAKPNKGKTLAGTDSEEDLWEALALSLQDMKLNEGKRLQRQLLSAPSSSLADLQKQHNLSVEDMARIISRRAAEKESPKASSSKGKGPEYGGYYDDDTDEDLDRAIAMSLQDME